MSFLSRSTSAEVTVGERFLSSDASGRSCSRIPKFPQKIYIRIFMDVLPSEGQLDLKSVPWINLPRARRDSEVPVQSGTRSRGPLSGSWPISQTEQAVNGEWITGAKADISIW